MSASVATIVLSTAVMATSFCILSPCRTAMAAPETVIYNFGPTGTASPSVPLGAVTLDAAGNIYGTTEYGGTNRMGLTYTGTVYKVSQAGQLTILKSLPQKNAFPRSGVTLDNRGNVYGTTYGSYDYVTGSVFALRANGNFQSSVFSQYTGQPLGPQSSLIPDGNGNLYGTSSYGGADGDGSVFRISPDGTVSVLYSFGSFFGDGQVPGVGALTLDPQGNLYGATNAGGGDDNGGGTIFKIDPSGFETILYQGYLLAGYSDECSHPNGGLARDEAGNLYGTTSGGGGFYGCIFQLTPSGTFKS